MPELYDETGQRVRLGERLGRGGEGEVFAVAGSPDLVAKVLHSAGRTAAKHGKVAAMLRHPPAGATDAVDGFPVLTWPRAMLHARPDKQGPQTFVGYLMARIQPRDFVPISTLTSAARRAGLGGQPLTWDRLVLLALRLSHLVRTLHRFGYAVGDLNDRNVLVSRRLTPLLMDTDSFQVPRPGGGHFPSVVGDQQYWAPELLEVDLATHKGSRVQGDLHALGVLLFQLLMGGWRPYQATGSQVAHLETLAEKTKAGHFPWARPKRGVLDPPAAAPRYSNLPRPLRQAFERCFVDGHRRPGKRPSADDWYAALAQVHGEGYRTCAVQARHVIPARAATCPWCADPNDPFTASRKAVRLPRAPPPQAPKLVRAQGKAGRAAGPPLLPMPAKPPAPRPSAGAAGATRAPQARPPRARRPGEATRGSPSRGKARTAADKRQPATAPRARSPAGRRGDRPLAEAWPVRGAWVGGLSLAFASPALLLPGLADSPTARIVLPAATAVVLCAIGLAASLPWLRSRRGKAQAAWLSLTAGTAAALGLVGVGRWAWMAYATGLACLALGAGVYLALERRQPKPFVPKGRGLLNGALGVPAAYLPVLMLWGLG